MSGTSILYLTRFAPRRDGIGQEQRAWHIWQALKERETVRLLILHPGDPGTQTDGHEALVLPSLRAPSKRGTKRLPWVADGLHDALHGWHADTPRLSSGDARRLRERLAPSGGQRLVTNKLSAATLVCRYAADLFPARHCFADIDDIISRVIERQIAAYGGNVGRQGALALRLQRRAAMKWEQQIATHWGAGFLCSADDVQLLSKRTGGTRLRLLPNVIDKPRLEPRPADGRLRILFVGTLDYYPNLFGVRTFLDQAWTAVRETFGDKVVLTVAGRAAGRPLAEHEGKAGVEIIYNAPDLTRLYATADLCIVPLWVGGGTRIKIIEAMAHGRAVVSTAIGAEGLSLSDGTHFLEANEPADFVRRITELVQAPQRAQAIVEAAHDFYLRHYHPRAITRALDETVFAHRDGRAPDQA